MPAAAFEATYSDWKLIRTRKCVQIVLEIPLEKSNEAYDALGGMPNAGAEVWVGVARLDMDKVSSGAVKEAASNGTDSPVAAASKPRTPIAPENRMKTRCAILCGDRAFWQFLNETYRKDYPLAHVTDAEGAASLVRFLCDVKSRSEIMPGTRVGARWDEILHHFTIWEQADQYIEEPA